MKKPKRKPSATATKPAPSEIVSPFAGRSTIFQGKKAVISGGTTGIGRAAALQLAAWGADVLIFGRHKRELKDALADLQQFGGKVVGVTADQSEIKDVGRVFKLADAELGGIDFLINNAAVGGDSLEKISDEDADYTVRANLVGYILCTRHALKRMKSGAHIVNVGSISADKRKAGGEIYTATKAGIQGFSESLRKTVRPKGIRVTLVQPGLVGTDMIDEGISEQREAESKGSMLIAEDIASSIAFCLSQPPRCCVNMIEVRPSAEEEE